MGIMSGILDLVSGDSEDYFTNVTTPNVEDMRLKLDEYVLQGLMTPDEAQYFAQNPSEFEQIQSDPQFKEAQMAALSGLQDYANEGGLNAQARGRLNDIAKEEGIRERGAREAVLQNANARGVGGSGLEFLSQLKNQQESASRQSDRDTQVAADAEMRALDALVRSGSMAGDIRGQDFSEQARKAEAMDAINRFNTGNMIQNSQFNTGIRNQAQQYNLDTKQGLSDANTNIRNKQQGYNKELLQQDYNNKMRQAAARAGAFTEDYERKRRGVGDVEKGIGEMFKAGAF